MSFKAMGKADCEMVLFCQDRSDARCSHRSDDPGENTS